MPPKLRAFVPARRSVAALVALVAATAFATPAAAVRIMDFNLLNWGGSSGLTRTGFMLSITRGIAPDVVVAQEVTDQGGVDLFLTSVLNWREPGQWASAPFDNGPDTDNALWYKPSKWTYLDKKQVHTALRDITRWHLRLAGYNSAEAEVYIYSMHLKASTGFEAQRLEEMKICRRDAETTLPFGAHVLMCGDMNTYNYSSETCFQWALSDTGQNIGRMRDVIAQVGQWHDSFTYAPFHTQSPRTLQFGGGATGGMDDRFDWILASYNWQDGFGMDLDASTYKAYGNNGAHCCNGAINTGTVAPYSQTAMDSLMNASDHIPVQVDVIVPSKAAASTPALAFGSVFVGPDVEQPLSLSNPVTDLPADGLNYSFDTAPAGFTAPVTAFVAPPQASGPVHAIGMQAGSPGPRNASLGIFTDAPDQSFLEITLTGSVLAHAKPSTDSLTIVPDALVDFGTQSSGGFSDQPAIVRNAGGFDPFQGKLRVAAAAITGPDAARFSLVEPFAAALIGAEGARYDVHFDDSGLTSDSTFTADLVFQTEDDPSVPNALSPLAPVTFHLAAAFTGSTVGVGDELPTATLLYAPTPNPVVSSRVALRFDLATAGRASLELYDVRGRRVALLADGERPAGRHTIAWDGRDAGNRPVASGVYFVRLVTAQGAQSKRFLVLQP
jgi:endonuclease/exonuclease/phosphatase family metal-dependent hydrolase